MGGTVKQLLLSLVGVGGASGRHRDTEGGSRRQLQTVELRVSMMDCDRCEHQVRKALAGMRGVEHVEVNRRQQRVAVTGTMDPHKVLRRAQSTGKKAELWPQNPNYSSDAIAMAHYRVGAAQAHDRWAPARYPRNTDTSGASAEHITNLFSDDNPNACSIM